MPTDRCAHERNSVELTDGWTIVGPADRAMDVHLLLLAEAATAALRDVEIKRELAAKADRLHHRLRARVPTL